MVQNTLIHVSVDDSLRKDADTLFSDLGLDTPTAIRIFLKQAINRKGLPFDVVQPVADAETVASMEGADRISPDSDTRKYKDFSELLADVQRNAILHRTEF